MIRLTTKTKLNKKGETVDASLYLVKFGTRNLAIVEGVKAQRGYANGQVKGYYGDLRSALVKAIDIVIKDVGDTVELSAMLTAIDNLTKRIEDLCSQHNYPSMIQLIKGTDNA